VKATAIVPVKRFGAAKSRLAAGIDRTRREALAAAMLADVLEAIAAARTVERTIVITAEPRAAEAATLAGARVISDRADEGHSEAALAGVAAAEEEGAACVVLLPIDCPLLDPHELDRLLTGVPESYVSVVPDRHGTGTNALVLAPPGAIAPAFGEGSCERHLAAARKAGIPYGVEELASLGLDLDTPADIVALARALGAHPGRAKRTARALGI
jgi:2-phospho-L-lactate/phosphoenolpyruvate guanylyltransferase